MNKKWLELTKEENEWRKNKGLTVHEYVSPSGAMLKAHTKWRKEKGISAYWILTGKDKKQHAAR